MQQQRPATRQLPGIGVAVAALGVLMLFFASTSMNWIDVSEERSGAPGGVSMDLSEARDMAEFNETMPILEWYGNTGWILVFLYVLATAVFATLLNPSHKGARSAIWAVLYIPFPFAPVLGAGLGFINLADDDGRVAPRILGASAMVAPAFPLVMVWIDLLNDFDSDFDSAGLASQDIGMGLWVSMAALVVVMIGCGLGTRTVPAAPSAVGPMGMGQPPMGGPQLGPDPMGHPPVSGGPGFM